MKSHLCHILIIILTILSVLSITGATQASSTLWPGTIVPGIADTGPDSAVELGVKFRSDSGGSITGVRFYKAAANTGTHVGNLWSSSGALLATATFTNETASGWQQVNFTTPVVITANTYYVASYHTNTGHYSDSYDFFTSVGVDSPPLHAPAAGVSGLNGVYAYGSTSTFPKQGWRSSNYWVDVVFSETAPSDTTAPTVTAFTVPAAATSLSVSISSFTATDNVGVTGYLVNESATAPAAGASGWSTTAPTTYTCATAGSKTLYAWAKDAAGNVSASSSANVVITIPDTTAPTVTSFTIPAAAKTLTVLINSFTATDNIGVTGYLVNESATAPSAAASGWSTTVPASYTFTSTGNKILFAWAKDAAGNVSASSSASVTVDTTRPAVGVFTIPGTSSSLVVPITSFTATDNVGVTGYLVTASATAPAASAGEWLAAAPDSYTCATAGSKTLYAWAKDAAGNVSASKSDSVTITLPPSGPPILIVSAVSNPFSAYYAEILRTEGFNSFTMSDISSVSSTLLASCDVVILGEMPLTASQITMFSNWVNAGGQLIAMRPDKKLAGLLGLSDLATTISNAYLLVNTLSVAGAGIVNQTIQYHGTADLYNSNDALILATLYANATTATSNPAVTLHAVGTMGGEAAAFTYDLARSIIYTRQGNPAWSGQERDGYPPIRSDDLFYGAASSDPKPDWVDPDKVAIPQADEQQRLLANLIIRMNLGKRPVPRFWYLPRGLAAAVVMTGDDHANGGTAGRFDDYKAMSPQGCSVDNWECIRSTSYIYTDTPLSNAQAASYDAAGFEVALHLSTNCADWTAATLRSFLTTQLSAWAAKYSSLPSPVTNRTHCITWSDYATEPVVELASGIRLDTTYYYWPAGWVANTPGVFTGSGMPMRFAAVDGTLIDVYQAATQMTDESGQVYPYTIDELLDRATGPEGYYGVFVANIHTDAADSSDSDAIIQSAQAHGIPVISARQMLQWLDGRNGSTFSAISYYGSTLNFSIGTAQGAKGLVAMVPVAEGQKVSSITINGSSVPFTLAMVKGIDYARFSAATGTCQVTYTADDTPPTVSGVAPAVGTTGVDTGTVVTAIFSEPMVPATVAVGTCELRNPANTLIAAAVTYDPVTQTVTIVPAVSLANSTTYTVTIKGGANGVKDLAGNQLATDFTWSFTTVAASTGPYSLWTATATPGKIDSGPDSAVELGMKFRADSSGTIKGIRFYKAAANTGTHVANLWTISGTLLATATFSNETASGWQQVNFPTPVSIAANTVYVASYHTNTGHYSVNLDYFAISGVDQAKLHAPSSTVSSPNGVFGYGSASKFPNQSWNSSNYWVDVLFQP